MGRVRGRTEAHTQRNTQQGNPKSKEKKIRVETPLASYRIGFGPEARNRKKIGKIQKTASPKKIGKKWPKNRKMAPKPYFRAIFPIFRLFFSYFLGEAVFCVFPIFFLFQASGPKPIL